MHADIIDYPIQVVDASKIRVVGGWESHLDENRQMALVINQTKRIEFNVREAGSGRLTAEVVGPGGLTVPTYVDQRGDDVVCSFTPTIEGEDSEFCDN